MAHLYTNENFPLPAAQELRRLGHDVMTVLESGLAGQAVTDDAVMSFVTEQGRAVVTMNRRHFVRLHQVNPHHAGIVVCTADSDFAGLALRIHEAIQESPDLATRLLRVNRRV